MEEWRCCCKHAALDGSKRLLSCLLVSANWRGGGMGPRAMLTIVPYPCWNLNPSHSGHSLVPYYLCYMNNG